jgi:hypothetical protein
MKPSVMDGPSQSSDGGREWRANNQTVSETLEELAQLGFTVNCR